MNFEKVFPFPSQREIENHQNPHRRRAPYISAWLTVPPGMRYTEYMIDFKASRLPRGTYLCLGNWAMDLSSLERRYTSVRTEYAGVNAYAGFQKLANGRTASIMSFWDVYCKDASGRESTVRAKRLYPNEVINGGVFGGEGIGARSLSPFEWGPDRWYCMYLKCIPSPEKTIAEQWVYDYETGEYSLLCRFDTGIANSSFMGNIAVFLENFLPESAAEVRTMEVSRAKYLDARTKKWQNFSKAYVASQGGAPTYEGSYNFGVSGDCLWMITSGVGGDWFKNGKGKGAMYVKF